MLTLRAAAIALTSGLVLVFGAQRASGQAGAPAPRVVVRDTGTEIEGFPAISRDGSTLVEVTTTSDVSGAESTSVAFVGVTRDEVTQSWVIAARDESGNVVVPADDGHGATPWRRARTLTLELEAQGYRAMIELSAHPESAGVFEGGGLRLVQTRALVVVTDARGRVRLRHRLRPMRAFCGMSDDAPRREIPSVSSVFVDPASGTLRIVYGIAYASCMCEDDIERATLRLSAA